MTVHRNDTHKKQANAWAEKTTKGLSANQLVKVFAKAFHEIEQRSLRTLSSVTIAVVVDRALHESTEAFPLLSDVKIESGAINLNGLLGNSGRLNSEELRQALLRLLVELLNVLGNITADILTEPLHKVLIEVTNDLALAEPEQQNLHSMSSAKKNRDKA